MFAKVIRKSRLAAVRQIKRIQKNIEGVAAVEFGFIAPIMMIMLVGTAEACRAITMDRRFGLATQMIGDLITREEDMTAANITKIYEIVEHVMGGYDNGSMKISIIPVRVNSDSTAVKVYATNANRPPLNGGVDELAKGDDYPLSEDMRSDNAVAIVIKSSFEFKPIFLGYIFGNMSWTDSAVLSPRSGCVNFDGEDGEGCLVSFD